MREDFFFFSFLFCRWYESPSRRVMNYLIFIQMKRSSIIQPGWCLLCFTKEVAPGRVAAFLSHFELSAPCLWSFRLARELFNTYMILIEYEGCGEPGKQMRVLLLMVLLELVADPVTDTWKYSTCFIGGSTWFAENQQKWERNPDC